jgi:hypothetical protein
MIRRQLGFRGVLFARAKEDAAVISLWSDATAVGIMEHSHSYQATVARIVATGFLEGEAHVEVYDLHGGALTPELQDALPP